MIGRTFAVVAALAAAIVVTPQAAAHPGCTGYRVALFGGEHYSGVRGCFNVGSPDLRPIGFVRRVGSAWNHDTEPWCLFDEAGYRRPVFQLDPGGHYPTLPPNHVRSLRRGPCPQG